MVNVYAHQDSIKLFKMTILLSVEDAAPNVNNVAVQTYALIVMLH
jgi:hypothetical protein